MNPSCTDSAVTNSILIDAKLEEHRVCESTQCPSCGHKLLDHKPDWVGLPAGVKFDPTDQELIDHLEAKVKAHDLKSHPLIDEFIPTIEGEDGICYTHPEKLPGVTMDGLSKHFFHRPSKAYTTGTRKRRKIQSESKGETRWHKTGKTRPVMVNGQHKGCKKILVLYTNFGKHRKPEKTYWVMHQYHLGEAEEEKDGELVVSKIFYQTQPRQCTSASASAAAASLEEGEMMVEQYSRNSGGSGSCSSSREVVIGNRSDEKLPSVYSCIRMQQHMMKTDNFCSFAPFSHTFSEVDMGEAGKAMGTDELVADVRVPLHRRRHHHLVQEQQRQQLANFNIERPVNCISNLISSTPVLQQASIVLENPYHAPMMLLQTDNKFQQPQQPQQEKVDHRSAASLEDLIMSCSTVGIKGEASIPHSQAAEWQYSYWPSDNLEHDHPGQ